VLLDLPIDVLTAQIDENSVRIPQNMVLDSLSRPLVVRSNRLWTCWPLRSGLS